MPFRKGTSGNPKGRPKRAPLLAEVEEMARYASPRAIARLKEWLNCDDGRISVAAAKVLLDRGFGTPPQTVTATIDDHRSVLRAPGPSDDATSWRADYAPPVKPH